MLCCKQEYFLVKNIVHSRKAGHTKMENICVREALIVTILTRYLDWPIY